MAQWAQLQDSTGPGGRLQAMPGSFKNADEMREFAMSAAPVDLGGHLQEFGGLVHGHMSQKPEAGKWADKMRCITSAEELFREMWSEFETNIAFLLPTTASATLGRSKSAMDRQFRTIYRWQLGPVIIDQLP